MSYLAYIIGDVPSKINPNCLQLFENAKIHLERKGFAVINPIDNLLNEKLTYEEAYKINIGHLLNCNAVYILPTISLEPIKSPELLMAIKLNLLIIQGVVSFSRE
jgi:hypothetical protein